MALLSEDFSFFKWDIPNGKTFGLFLVIVLLYKAKDKAHIRPRTQFHFALFITINI